MLWARTTSGSTWVGENATSRGEIDELRISDIMRYRPADRVAVVRRELPDAGLNVPYAESLSADAAQGAVTWKVAAGRLPAGLQLDEASGTISGTPTEVSEEAEIRGSSG